MTREEWIKHWVAKAPPVTQEQWEAANAALGIFVRRKPKPRPE